MAFSKEKKSGKIYEQANITSGLTFAKALCSDIYA